MNDNRDTINQIKDSIDIVSLIERSVRLKKAGKNYLGLCPFHNEKTPSFIVSPDIQRYKCFGCGKSGDIFNFVQESEGVEFIEALKKLAEEAGIKLEQKKGSEKYSDLLEINESAMKFFEAELAKNKEVQKYLADRGLSKESISSFNVGFAGSYNSLLKYMQSQKKYKRADLLKTGLFTEKNGAIKDRFIKRVMFPIKSISGRVIAFSGRQLPGDTFGPKYLNTPETDIFHKRETLFGISESKNDIRKARYAVLCEGQTDVISAHSVGIKNIVAPLGTGLTSEQVSLLKRYTENLHFVFDADSAGQKAVERGFKIAAKLGMNTYAASPSPAKDIDELINKDPDAAKKVCKPKLDAFTFLIAKELEQRDITQLKDYNYINNYAGELISNVVNPAHKKFYLGKLKRMTGIDMGQVDSGNKPNAMRAEKKQSDNRYLWSEPENYFLALILREKLFESLENLSIKYFKNPDVKEIITLVKKEGSKISEKVELLSDTARALFEAIYFNIDSLPEINGDVKEELNVVYKRIKSDYSTALLNKLRIQLAAAEEEGSQEKINSLLERINQLTLSLKRKK